METAANTSKCYKASGSNCELGIKSYSLPLASTQIPDLIPVAISHIIYFICNGRVIIQILASGAGSSKHSLESNSRLVCWSRLGSWPISFWSKMGGRVPPRLTHSSGQCSTI